MRRLYKHIIEYTFVGEHVHTHACLNKYSFMYIQCSICVGINSKLNIFIRLLLYTLKIPCVLYTGFHHSAINRISYLLVHRNSGHFLINPRPYYNINTSYVIYLFIFLILLYNLYIGILQVSYHIGTQKISIHWNKNNFRK